MGCRGEQPEQGLRVHGADLHKLVGSGLGGTYCCWHCFSGPGVSTSLQQQQVAIGTGWRQCCSRCLLWARGGQCVTLSARGLMTNKTRTRAWQVRAKHGFWDSGLGPNPGSSLHNHTKLHFHHLGTERTNNKKHRGRASTGFGVD